VISAVVTSHFRRLQHKPQHRTVQDIQLIQDLIRYPLVHFDGCNFYDDEAVVVKSRVRSVYETYCVQRVLCRLVEGLILTRY